MRHGLNFAIDSAKASGTNVTILCNIQRLVTEDILSLKLGFIVVGVYSVQTKECLF